MMLDLTGEKLRFPDGSGRQWHESYVLGIGDTHRILMSYGRPVAFYDGTTVFRLSKDDVSPTAMRQIEVFSGDVRTRRRSNPTYRIVSVNDLGVLLGRLFLRGEA